jgi:choline-glycine betaine transporter
MSTEQMQALQYLVSLPLQAILLIAVAQLWKALTAAQNARVDDLKQNYEKNLADLRTRVMLLEDRAGVYVPNALNSTEKPVSSGFGVKDVKTA